MSIKKALEVVNNNQSELARRIGVSRCYVNKMLRDNHVPVEQLKAIEKATGVSRQELRPDLYD